MDSKKRRYTGEKYVEVFVFYVKNRNIADFSFYGIIVSDSLAKWKVPESFTPQFAEAQSWMSVSIRLMKSEPARQRNK